jgi:photosystem II stability/assembly factor-like uncharacterized protein
MFFALSLATTNAQDVWVARDGAVKNSELKDVVVSRDALYIATRSVLYKARDIKERWEPVFSLPGSGSNEITCLAGRLKAMFIGTRRGLYRSDDFGQTWKNVFRTMLPDKNNITYIELSRHNRFRVLISTEKGIFSSDDLGARWRDIGGILKNTPVKCLALNRESMYAGTESGLYMRKKDCEDWERIFVRSAAQNSEMEEPEGSTDYNEKDTSIRTIAIDGARVYIGYSKVILYSDDQGKNWKDLPCEGLRGEITHILISAKNKKIYCATYRGVFEFDPSAKAQGQSGWRELYKGMAKGSGANRLIFGSDDENIIFAATDKGLYSFQSGDYPTDKYPDIERSLNTLKIAFDGEPAYKELQQAAIKFCDVSPEKIISWHRDSRIKAVVPKLSFGMDNHRSTNSEIYTSATKEYVTVGPDDTYNSLSASVSWDLGNLIWSDDQTNIDVRSRLTTQLRNDILDDLRRAYYERKRLRYELITNPPKDPDLHFSKELRLQELTQAIDDLTGNYLSEHIKKKP